MTMPSMMLDESAVRKRAATSYDRNWRTWAQERFSMGESAKGMDAAGADAVDTCVTSARAAGVDATGTCVTSARAARLNMSLKPPRERDLESSAMVTEAREWVAGWHACPLQSQVSWETRSWARIGAQTIPVRVSLETVEDIALWAGRAGHWELALRRLADVRRMLDGPWRGAGRASDVEPYPPAGSPAPVGGGFDAAGAMPPGLSASSVAPADSPATEEAVSTAVKASIGDWCKLGEEDWRRLLDVLTWLLSNQGKRCYVRQLPIRGVDTKWVETHGHALRPLYRALTGTDFVFKKPGRQFRCAALGEVGQLGGCSDFALSADQLDRLKAPPRAVVICENLVNVLSLGDAAIGGDAAIDVSDARSAPDPAPAPAFSSSPGLSLASAPVLAIHGGGFAVKELASVSWLSDVPILYWGDLDTNGFAILNILRGFAPHAQSIMMDAETLSRHFDLCVEEPTPAVVSFNQLTPEESATLQQLFAGDPTRGISTLRLEQERIEWRWALQRINDALTENHISS